MEVTKEMFIDFLKENNFYEAWFEGYNIDNEIWNDNVPFDKFINKGSAINWFYSGVTELALVFNRPKEESDLQRRYDEWRKNNLNTFLSLDKKWMQFVSNTHNIENNEKSIN